MPEELEVTSRQEGQVGILETDGYINDTEAERVAKAGLAAGGPGLLSASRKHVSDEALGAPGVTIAPRGG